MLRFQLQTINDSPDEPSRRSHAGLRNKIQPVYGNSIPSSTDVVDKNSFNIVETLGKVFPLDETRVRRTQVFNDYIEFENDTELTELRMKLKSMIANLSAYISEVDLRRLYQEIDRLLDPEDWELDSKLPTIESLRDYLKLYIFSLNKKPAIAISSEGYFTAMWKTNDLYLVIYFKGGGRVRLSYVHNGKHGPERSATECSFARMFKLLPEHESLFE